MPVSQNLYVLKTERLKPARYWCGSFEEDGAKYETITESISDALAVSSETFAHELCDQLGDDWFVAIRVIELMDPPRQLYARGTET